MIATNDKLRAELPALLDSLSRTNGSLQNIVDRAGGDLAKHEATLGVRLSDFQTAIDTVAKQVNALESIAGGALGDATSIVGAMETHSQSLAQSASQLTRSQSALDQAFEARRQSLAGLVSLIETKQSEFEGALASFSGLMDDSLRNVEARARDIGGVIEKTTKETADIVDERFGAVRTAAEQERARTAATMRAAYEQANSELSCVFAQASEKFNAAAGEIRGLAQQIYRELETTREEVRRGAQELPRETAEQASALRRVVGDQVKALNELTDIVARSGRVYDIAEPAGAAPRRAFEPQASNPRRRSAAPSRRPAPNPRAKCPAPTSRSRMEPPGWSRRASWSRRGSVRPRRRQPPRRRGPLPCVRRRRARRRNPAGSAICWSAPRTKRRRQPRHRVRPRPAGWTI